MRENVCQLQVLGMNELDAASFSDKNIINFKNMLNLSLKKKKRERKVLQDEVAGTRSPCRDQIRRYQKARTGDNRDKKLAVEYLIHQK